jgi:hypothetical protein
LQRPVRPIDEGAATLEALVWPQQPHYKNHRAVFGIDQNCLPDNALCACME